MRRPGGVLAGVLLAAGGLAAVGVPVTAGAASTTLFDGSTSGAATATVPAGICSVRVVAVGGGGGGSTEDGGAGAQVTTTLSVTPGQVLSLFIGGGGAGGSTGPAGVTTYTTAANGGPADTAGGDGSLTITYDPATDSCPAPVEAVPAHADSANDRVDRGNHHDDAEWRHRLR